MGFYPVVLDLGRRSVLVVGGGAFAERLGGDAWRGALDGELRRLMAIGRREAAKSGLTACLRA